MPELPPPRLVDAPVELSGRSERTFPLGGRDYPYPDFENADTFVSELVRSGVLVTDDIVRSTLRGERRDLSARSLQRRFIRATGLAEGTLLQIERARAAVELLERGVPILDATDQSGYADQSHLTRSLRRFWGYTPAQILRGMTR